MGRSLGDFGTNYCCYAIGEACRGNGKSRGVISPARGLMCYTAPIAINSCIVTSPCRHQLLR
jgi:hypothetical protein